MVVPLKDDAFKFTLILGKVVNKTALLRFHATFKTFSQRLVVRKQIFAFSNHFYAWRVWVVRVRVYNFLFVLAPDFL